MSLKEFLKELKRRKIYRVTIAYLVLAWLILQIISVIQPIIEAPPVVSKVSLVLLLVGFPIALILAWAQGLSRAEGDKPRKSIFSSNKRTNDSKSNKLPSIAILPFNDLSADKDQGYFSQGMAEEIILALNRMGNLRVVAQSAVAFLQPKKYSLNEIGELLGVETLLEGSIRKEGKKLRISTKLISVKDNSHIWSTRYDRELEDIFTIQDDISEKVALAIKGTLTKDERGAIQSSKTNIAAFEHFLKGRQLFHQLSTTDAREMLEKAIKLDPSYGPAYAALADVFSWKFQWEKGDKDDLAAADKYSKKALELAPELSESYSARAFVLSLGKNFKDAEVNYKKAIEINPASFNAYYFYARSSFANGEIEKSVQLFQKASEVNLEDFSSLILLGQAMNVLEKGSGSDALILGIKRAENLLKLNPFNQRAWSLGASSLMGLGRTEEALKWIEKAVIVKADDPSVQYNAACAYTIHGQHDKALELLEKYSERSGNKDWIKRDPDLKPLHDYPRFKKILKRLDKH